MSLADRDYMRPDPDDPANRPQREPLETRLRETLVEFWTSHPRLPWFLAGLCALLFLAALLALAFAGRRF